MDRLRPFGVNLISYRLEPALVVSRYKTPVATPLQMTADSSIAQLIRRGLPGQAEGCDEKESFVNCVSSMPTLR